MRLNFTFPKQTEAKTRLFNVEQMCLTWSRCAFRQNLNYGKSVFGGWPKKVFQREFNLTDGRKNLIWQEFNLGVAENLTLKWRKNIFSKSLIWREFNLVEGGKIWW